MVRENGIRDDCTVTVFRCEDAVDGIFTAVYDAWASRLGHSRVALELESEPDLRLFCTYRQVQTDAEKARKVADTVRRRMGPEDYENIYHCALAADGRKADCIYRAIALGLTGRGMRNVTRSRQRPFIQTLDELALRVWHEAHRYTGFLRFEELENGILYARVDSPHQILSLLGEHFADRYPGENFVISRKGTGRCVVHGAGKPWFIARGAALSHLDDMARTREQGEMERLWQSFFTCISIKERENRARQQGFLPKRMREFLPEFPAGESPKSLD